MKSENKINFGSNFFDIIVLIIVMLYFIFLLSVINNRSGMLGWDEAARSMGGVTLIKYLTGKLSFENTIGILGANHYYVYQGTFLYGPLHALSTATTSLLFGFSVQTARLPAAIFGALGILAAYSISRIMYKDGRIAVFTALFLVGSTVYFDFSTMNFSEVPITFAISIGTYLLFKVKKLYTKGETENIIKHKTGYYILLSAIAGIAFGFAGLTKPSAAIMAVPIGIYILHSSMGKKESSVKKKSRKKREKSNSQQRMPINQFIILSIPFVILGLSVVSYWSYLKSIGFYQLYLNFWMGGRGFHPETEPFSLNVFLESWKLLLAMFPVLVVLLLLAGLYHAARRKPDSEEVFLISWIAVYFLSLFASGAISPQYPLPAIPAMAIFASTAMVKIIDLYNPSSIFRRLAPDNPRKLNWKSGVAAILIILIVIQVAMVPVYKSISLRSGNEIKGEAYNPLIIRTSLQKHAPSLFWINTLYYNGSTTSFYERAGLDEDKVDTYRSLAVNVVRDIQKNDYQTATVIFLSELSNYFDFWFTADDRYLTYRFVTLEPDMLSQYVAQDKAPKYLIISKENEKKLIQNINEKESKLKYSIYKIHVSNNSIQLENMNIDQIVGYT